MSKGEQILEATFKKADIEYVPQKVIGPVPFNSNKKHKADFYIPSKDLYIEVKGQMTLYEVNVLKYLQEHAGINLYIFQTTCEDWITPYNKVNHKSVNKKISTNIDQQLQEIIGLSTQNLVGLSKSRLKKYISYRNGDLKRWCK